MPEDTEIPRCGGECWNTGEGYERVMRNARALLARQAAAPPEISQPVPDEVADERGQLALFGA